MSRSLGRSTAIGALIVTAISAGHITEPSAMTATRSPEADPPSYSFQWGELGTDSGKFDFPHGMDVGPDGSVYVCDNNNHRVQRFDSEGAFVSQWGSQGEGDGQFSAPADCAVGPSGDVYVADGSRVQRFDAGGRFLGKWGGDGTGDGQFRSAGAIAVGPNGNVFVADTFRMQVFSSNGTFLKKWGRCCFGEGDFNGIAATDVDRLGNVYVASWGRLQKFDSNGNFLAEWEGVGSETNDIAVDRSGRIYLTDNQDRNNRVLVYGSDLTLLTEWGTRGTGEGEFDDPQGLAIGPDGRVLVADVHNHRIQVFRYPPDTLEVHILDVGHGDAALVTTSSGMVVAIDAGPAGAACDSTLAYYNALGILAIDYLIVSNYDAESIGCVPRLIKQFPVVHDVIDRGGRDTTAAYAAYRTAVGKQRKKARPGKTSIPLSRVGRRQAGSSIDIIAANGKSTGGTVRVPPGNQNDRGVVALLSFGEFDALFGGDIGGMNVGEVKDVEAIVADALDRIELYKIHRNGSEFSSSANFLQAVTPLVAMLSADETNEFGLPASAAVARLRAAGVKSYWTSPGNGVKAKKRFERVCKGPIVVTVESGGESFAVQCRRRTTEYKSHNAGEADPETP